MWISRKPLQAFITPGLAFCGALILFFYFSLFLRDNSAPTADLTNFEQGPGYGFRYQVERCWLNDKKIAVSGWLVREGYGTSRRTVRVIVLDAAGVPHALKTTLTQRDDVNDLLANTLVGGIKYRNIGFTASLNLAAANVELDRRRLYLAYDDGNKRTLIPVECPGEQSR